MSLGSPEGKESPESHPLYQPLKQRCLVLVDEKGWALDSTKPMREEGRPDLAVVHAVGKSAEDLTVGTQNCLQFVQSAEHCLSGLGDGRAPFVYADKFLLGNDSLVIIDRPDPEHVFALNYAHRNAGDLRGRVDVAFARFQAPYVEDEKYKPLYHESKLPKHETPARILLDRVKLMKGITLARYDDSSPDYVLYTGGGFPMPYAYRQIIMDERIRVIAPHQLVYGLQAGVLLQATDLLKTERPSGTADYIREHVNWLDFMEKDDGSQTVFYFKSEGL